MSDAELLSELAHFDEVEAITLGDGDHMEGYAPLWAEIRLVLDESGHKLSVDMTRHDGELIIEVLWSVLHPNDNRQSPVQRLWTELDDVMDFLMDVDEPEPEDKARAKALALSIALISQPWAEEPDIDSVRAEAVERWEERQ